MKIQSLETFVVGTPSPGWGGQYFIFVKLTTSNGIVGYGEVYANTFGPQATVAGIEDVFQRCLERADPFQIELFWRKAYGAGYIARPDVSLMGIISGLSEASRFSMVRTSSVSGATAWASPAYATSAV